MAKKKKRNAEKAEHIIDNIPNKYSQQPRSSKPKRRSDFSFFCSFPLSNSGSLQGSSFGEGGSSNVTLNSLHGRHAEGKKMPEHSLIRCSKSQNRGLRFSSNFYNTPLIEVETVAQNELFDCCSERNVSEQTSDSARSLECTPKKSQVTEGIGFRITPGSIVWAKTACQMWWPAEAERKHVIQLGRAGSKQMIVFGTTKMIMDERSNLADSRNQDTDGHVLVEFYGSHDIAWLDPARDLSELEDCFQEKSCNPMEDFQDALKQALQRKEYLSSCRELCKSPNGPNHSDQQDEFSDKWTSSISSRADDDFLERGRGKRERKPKLHFDEVTFPMTSDKKVRRLRIMRYLGLSAPIGSPF
ncbi:uncharacterized protein LOC132192006 isoform X1 [Corylus avellana]|uniref:uncharacterized protein LOC132192006 isoform X1 n=1 Tax=Corylus avellana TaxID=13451 RepID=UPI001E1F3415|nr:uncharacterized protein LOC132192006 isoform X1 [Corylus avellana]